MTVEKARAALEAVRELDLDARDDEGLLPLPTADQFGRLMRIAEVHAMISIAESLQTLANKYAHHDGAHC